MFGLKITISECTWIAGNSSSCIDNIIANLKTDAYDVGVVDPCLFDYFGQCILFTNIKTVIRVLNTLEVLIVKIWAILKMQLNYINLNDTFARCPADTENYAFWMLNC